MPPPNARDGLKPDAASVERFRRDLAALIDIDQDVVVVAVSGGPDSVALLLLSHAVLGDRCFAATVDHGLRDDSRREAEWVAALCAARGIHHEILAGVLPDRAGNTANLSARARALRYRLLEEHALDMRYSWLATAHHADDQLETMVMRLNRGAGVAGLSAIRRRTQHGKLLIRPLLDWRRAELAAIVAACDIVPIADPSNVDDRFDRARLRKVLAATHWLDVEGFGRSADALASADNALNWSTRSLWRARSSKVDSGLELDATALPEEYLRRLATLCLEHLVEDRPLSGSAVMRFVTMLDSGRAATLAGVLAVPRQRDGRSIWTFRPAPPRRNT